MWGVDRTRIFPLSCKDSELIDAAASPLKRCHEHQLSQGVSKACQTLAPRGECDFVSFTPSLAVVVRGVAIAPDMTLSRNIGSSEN